MSSGLTQAARVFMTAGEDETIDVGRQLGSQTKPGDVFLLDGPLGAGKTVLVHGIALGLEIEQWHGSPTFVLVHEYEGRLPLYHVDLYRLDESEIGEIDVEWMVGGHAVMAAEWGEKLEPYLSQFHTPGRMFRVSLEQVTADERRITVSE